MADLEKQPLVSVIIPCYNAEKYVEQSVRSIMGQTYTNLEILIVNDASTDETGYILDRLKSEDKRIEIVTHNVNMGIVSSLNELVCMAKGKYIARMDADDISLPTRIEKQVEFMENNKDYIACGTNGWEIDSFGKRFKQINNPGSYRESEYIVRFYNPVCHPSVMFRKEEFSIVYDEEYLYAEDYELWCRLILANNKRIGNVQERLFLYRINQGQISDVKSEEQKILVKEIYRKYAVVPNRYMEAHEEVFALKTNLIDVNKVKRYITYCFLLSKGVYSDTVAEVVRKLMAYCVKRRFIFLALEMALSRLGRKAIIQKIKDMGVKFLWFGNTGGPL